MANRVKSILIVEDEVLVGLDLTMQLEEEGYEIIGPATTLSAAADMLRGQTPDFAILDANLNGECPNAIASDLQERGIPFVYVSGYGPDYIAQHLPIAPLLQKPVRIPLLLSQIETALAQ
ncbi:response regulator [Sulfitobacter aestuarii]|uniref:Response regulator n=1 Tax=Sulfitobacter aestuarii TaxID=2161676 RepID=A0ABW5U3Y6_9RHOB